MSKIALLALCLCATACAGTSVAPDVVRESYAPIPAGIETPSSADTSIGTLRFFDGLPDAATVDTVYDYLDFSRAVRTYLQAMPAASMMALREGLYAAGLLPNYTVFVSKSLVDARSRFLTLDTETVYATAWISLKGGPIVVETPPRTVGVFVDTWQRHLADTGYPGPDRGRGGRYVIVPPGYAGYVPESQFAVRSRTFGVWMLLQGFLVDGSTRQAVDNFESELKIYPLKESERPPPNQFVDMSALPINTIAPNDASYFESVDRLLQEEPRESQDPELLGLLASIGIEKDRKFEPTPALKATLAEAASVGDVTVRALLFGDRNPAPRVREGSRWRVDAMPESDDFVRAGARDLDARPAYRYYATAHMPRVADSILGRRYESAAVFADDQGRPLDGGRSYTLTLPAEVPASTFWSVVAYDNQTRSMVQTDQRFPSAGTAQTSLPDRDPPAQNEDGSTTLYFGPKPPPKGRQGRLRRGQSRTANWIQTAPGRGWNAVLRLYGAEDAWTDRSWVPGEIIRADDSVSPAPSPKRKPRMQTPLPAHFLERASIPSRLGTLREDLGVPTTETIQRVYANLDRARAVDAFLTTIHGVSMTAIEQGLATVGIRDADTIGIFERYVDAEALLLTASGDTVEAWTWLDLSAGAMVITNPPGTDGSVGDFSFASVTDLGPNGPDGGEGGLFLITPPNYEGQVSERYFSSASPTVGNLLRWRSLSPAPEPTLEVQRLEQTVEVYPYDFDFDEDFDFDAPIAEEADLEEEPAEESGTNTFVPLTGRPLSTIHPNDARYYSVLDRWIQREPAAPRSVEVLGLLRAVGIERGRTFDPTKEEKAIQADAAAIANATARALAFRSRTVAAYRSGSSGWYSAFVGTSSRFLRNGARILDARTAYYYLDTRIGPSITKDEIGAGTKTVLCATDETGRYLDGERAYTLTLPVDVPAQNGWSVVVYDPQTRSMLRAPGNATPTLSSRTRAIRPNPDGSTTLYFGPEAPAGWEDNWIETVPGKGWFVALRLNGPLKPWFDRTWQPGTLQPLP